jgi:hypothetical protein
MWDSPFPVQNRYTRFGARLAEKGAESLNGVTVTGPVAG